MELNARIENGNKFVEALKSALILNPDEIPLIVTKNGIRSKFMDCANVAMAELTILCPHFSEFDADCDFTIWVKAEELANMVKEYSRNSAVTICADDINLNIEFLGKIKKRFNFKCQDNDETVRNTPMLNFDVNLTLDAKTLKEALKPFKRMETGVYFECGNKAMTFADEDGKIKTEMMLEKEAQNVRVKFHSEYIDKLILKPKLTREIRLEVKADYPLRVTYDFCDLKLVLIVAPMVECD